MRYRINLSDNGQNLVDIDERQVYCPNASILGLSSRKAKPGMLVCWNDGPASSMWGRVIGRLERHPSYLGRPGHVYSDGSTQQDLKGSLLVFAVSPRGCHGYFRVILPEEVTELQAWPSKFLTWLANPTQDPRVLAEMVRYGSCSDSYIEDGEARARKRLEDLEALR